MDMEKQFKEELFSLLKKYGVEMELKYNYMTGDPEGINFWQYRKPLPGCERINFTTGLWEDGHDES
jgi:hypothetical protein